MSISQVQLSNPPDNRHGCLSRIYHVCQHVAIRVQFLWERICVFLVICCEWVKNQFIGPFTARTVPLLFDDFTALPDETVPIKDKMTDLARQLEIGRASSCEIADRILEKMPKGLISLVYVQRMKKRFLSGGELKLSTAIIVRSSKLFLDGRNHSNAENQQAACALLGSSEENDQKALKNVTKSFRNFELCISEDFQDLSGIFSASERYRT